MKRRPPPNNMRNVQYLGGNNRGKTVNNEGETLQYESNEEQAKYFKFLQDKNIKRTVSQPVQFEWFDENGKRHTYIPDLMVKLLDDSIIIYEIAMSFRRTKEESKQREKMGRAICKERGWTYIVIDESQIPQGAERANLLFFFGYRPTCYRAQPIFDAILNKLADFKKRDLSALVLDLEETGEFLKPDIYQTLFHMIWHCDIEIDWKRLFMDEGRVVRNTLIWRIEEL